MKKLSKAEMEELEQLFLDNDCLFLMKLITDAKTDAEMIAAQIKIEKYLNAK